MGHAMTIKEQYIRDSDETEPGSKSSFQKLVSICQRVRETAAGTLNEKGQTKMQVHSTFLESSLNNNQEEGQSQNHCFFPIQGIDAETKRPVLLMLPTEQVELSFVRAID